MKRPWPAADQAGWTVSKESALGLRNEAAGIPEKKEKTALAPPSTGLRRLGAGTPASSRARPRNVRRDSLTYLNFSCARVITLDEATWTQRISIDYPGWINPSATPVGNPGQPAQQNRKASRV